jgi:hypothetical protein
VTVQHNNKPVSGLASSLSAGRVFRSLGGLALESVERAPQYLARTELPRLAVESADIAEEEILHGAILKGNKYPGGRIGHEGHFAARAERRHVDGPK